MLCDQMQWTFHQLAKKEKNKNMTENHSKIEWDKENVWTDHSIG